MIRRGAAAGGAVQRGLPVDVDGVDIEAAELQQQLHHFQTLFFGRDARQLAPSHPGRKHQRVGSGPW